MMFSTRACRVAVYCSIVLAPRQELQFPGPPLPNLIRIQRRYDIHLRKLVLPGPGPHRIDDNPAIGELVPLAATWIERRIDIAGPAAIDDVGLRFWIPTGGE